MTLPALDIRYVAGALPSADADLAFLVNEVVWQTSMHARQTASFGLPYNYSGQSYPACEMPAAIAAIAARAAELAGHGFNNCLCNRYDTGHNTMGFHRDSYDGLITGSSIAIASFGATRTLVFRTDDQQHRVPVSLAHGSILLMAETTQQHWRHAMLRAPGAGRRISATFRLIAPGHPAPL
jgi:alkylated DNA repair dioxygenase AlkB